MWKYNLEDHLLDFHPCEDGGGALDGMLALAGTLHELKGDVFVACSDAEDRIAEFLAKVGSRIADLPTKLPNESKGFLLTVVGEVLREGGLARSQLRKDKSKSSRVVRKRKKGSSGRAGSKRPRIHV